MVATTSFQEKYYTSNNGLKLYYRDYNAAEKNRTPLLCLHGLTRNSKDFDLLARHLSRDHRVICLDVRGRGQSDYDPNYMNYQIPVYAQDVLTLIAHEALDQVILVGTSMGGLISLTLGAAKPEKIKAIILNDIGPKIDPVGLERIASYVGNAIILPTWEQAIAGVKILCANLFPDYNHDSWELFTRNTFRAQEDGTIVADYDQAIALAMKAAAENIMNIDMWQTFSEITQIPLLTLRGENSDILSHETLEKMAKSHLNFTKVTIENRAHTPDLNEDVSRQEIDRFLMKL